VREGNWRKNFEVLKEGKQDLIEEYVVAHEVGKESVRQRNLLSKIRLIVLQ